MEVESNLFQALNRNNYSVNIKYKERSRAITLNIKDDKNVEIRMKILFNIITSKQLCTMKEEDLMTTKERLAR